MYDPRRGEGLREYDGERRRRGGERDREGERRRTGGGGEAGFGAGRGCGEIYKRGLSQRVLKTGLQTTRLDSDASSVKVNEDYECS